MRGFRDPIKSGGASVAWGDITGTLSSQTDLQTALDAKLESGDNVSELVNDAGYITSASVTTSFIDLSENSTITGAINGVNTDYTVSQNQYTTGKLVVFRNGQGLTKGAGADWIELDANSGTFRILVPPTTGDRIMALYSIGNTTPFTLPEFVYVNSKDDLPTPIGGIITLADNYTYFFTATVDLTGDRLVCGQNTTILGASSENCRIKSTGLVGTALITSAWSLPMRGITIEANIALALDANGNANQALDWFGVNFTDCSTIGTIANYNNFIMTDSAFLNSAGLTFDGSIGTIGFTQCLFDGRTASTTITIPSTATITRRLRIIYSSFVTLSGETSLNISTSASIPVEGYILDTINFSGGGTYTSGVQYTDNKALFVNCRGINNTTALAYYYMNNNATATTIASAGVAYKIAGTTTNSTYTQKFTHTSNRATYTGALPRLFKVSANLTLQSTANNVIGIYIVKNGTIIPESETYITANAGGRFENGYVHTIVELVTNDYIEVFVENDTGANNITVESLSVIINVQE